MDNVFLYFKSEYSIGNSLNKIDPSVAYAKKLGYQALAIVDDGNVYGLIKFYQACIKHQIKPILGLEITYQYQEQSGNLLGYALNHFGYLNLLKLASIQKINNGQIALEQISANSLGVIWIINSTNPWLNSVDQTNHQGVIHLNHLKQVCNDLYLGLSTTDIIDDDRIKFLEYLSYQSQLKLVAIHKSLYLTSEDQEGYLLLQKINGQNNQDSTDYSMLLPHQLKEAFKDYPQAFQNSLEIANQVNLKLTFGKYQLPSYLPNSNQTIDNHFEYLKSLAYKGLEKRLSNIYQPNRTIYQQRLETELTTINQMGFCDYFLIVWDFILYAKKEKILVGPGRGSAAGSLVSYCLGITEINPIQYHLYFERFLNPQRITMPDIDIDFPDDKRNQVIKYVGLKYGKNRVANIVTFDCYKFRSVINDVIKAVGLSDHKRQEITKIISGQTLGSINETIEASEDLKAIINRHHDVRLVFELAQKLEGLPRHTSTHAAAIIIGGIDLVNYTGLSPGLNDLYQTQYSADDLESLGLLKIDFLGLRNLTIIKNTMDLIINDHPKFQLPTVFNDRLTFKMIASGNTLGVFQLESAGMRKVIKELHVDNFEELASALALYRPGPMEIIPLFIKRKFNKSLVTYPHPDLKPILEETYGTIVYQEQIMLIAWKFAGYSLGEADVLRRAVTKKNKQILEDQRTNFVKGCLSQGYDQGTANLIYDYIVKFAAYGFNKAHSVSYAVVAYYTAFLKCRYPSYYFASLLDNAIGASTTIENYLNEARSQQVVILPPDINLSKDHFVINDNQLRLSLLLIKGIGPEKVAMLLKQRTNNDFIDYSDFVLRTKDIINNTLVLNLIFSGALDCFKLTKKSMVETYQMIIDYHQYRFMENVLDIKYTLDEYSYPYLSQKEREAIGFNLQYDWLKQFSLQYPQYNFTPFNLLKPRMNAVVIGEVVMVKSIITRNNKPMLFIDIESSGQKLSIVVFNQQYQGLAKKQIIIVEGYVDNKKEQLQIVAQNLKIIT